MGIIECIICVGYTNVITTRIHIIECTFKILKQEYQY